MESLKSAHFKVHGLWSYSKNDNNFHNYVVFCSVTISLLRKNELYFLTLFWSSCLLNKFFLIYYVLFVRKFFSKLVRFMFALVIKEFKLFQSYFFTIMHWSCSVTPRLMLSCTQKLGCNSTPLMTTKHAS